MTEPRECRLEPPMHRPQPCPTCRVASRAIVDRRCLACRGGCPGCRSNTSTECRSNTSTDRETTS